MKVILIHNIKSGGTYSLGQLRTLFKQNGISISHSFSIEELGSEKLAVLVEKGANVAAVGGDGTLNAVARLVVNTKSRLLPLPGGTFNHFVRDIGGIPDLEDALKQIVSAEEMIIDVAYVNNELFLNNSNLGLYPFSLIEQKSIKKVIGKYPAAMISVAKQFSRFRRHTLTIDATPVKSPFVFVGNGYYDIESSIIPVRSDLARSTLTVMIASSKTRADLMKSLFAVIRGSVTKRSDFSLSHRTSLTIESRRTYIPVSLDGEVKRIVPPLRYRIEPKSLTLLVAKAP